MYSQGDTFNYDINGDEYELDVLGNFILDGDEYIIAEDFEGETYIFCYDEDEEEIVLVESKSQIKTVLKYWKDEYFSGEDISDFEEDEYYDREDSLRDEEFDDDFDIDRDRDDY